MKEFIEKIETLDNIHQWSERDSVIKESVSQHSFKVAAIANYLLRNIELRVSLYGHIWDRFKSQVLSYAIMHDFDEAIFGRDVSHMVKYNSFNGEHIRNAINEFVEHTLQTEFKGLVETPTPIVKHFVKLCDWLALLTFVTRNQKMGVQTFSKEDVYCREKIWETANLVNTNFVKEFNVKIKICSDFINLDEL